MKKIKLSAKTKSIWFKVFLIILFFAVFAMAFGMFLINYYSKDLPNTGKLKYFNPTQATVLYSADGKVIGKIFQENRIWISLNQVPQTMKNAIFAIEDSRFYRHHGIDLIGIMRAFIADLRHEEIKQGASTITQQLARNIFLTPEVSFQRKIKEIVLSLKMEKQFSKQEILEFYLNQIYFGSGAYGIESAARIYFDKEAKDLNLAECAILAGMPAAPSVYSPFVNMELAKQRQFQVLQRMAQLGYISKQEASDAYNQELKLAEPPSEEFHNLKYPYFTTFVVRQLFNSFSNELIFRGGLKVYTTLDTRMQDTAQKSVQWGIKKSMQEGVNGRQAALVSIEPQTGYIRAMVGGTGFKTGDQFNRAWQARRQPGSAFKIFVYTTAIDMGYLPQTIVHDSPITYRLSDGQVYSPINCDKKYWGPITVQRALQFSRNVAAVRVAHHIGMNRVIEYTHKMGIREKLEPHLSLALGSAVVSPLQMASAVSVLANEGVRVEPTAVIKVVDSNGRLLEDNTYPYQEEVVSDETAYTMVTMMKKVIEAGTGTNAQIGRPAAGKTGTTNDFRDAWFVGFTPQLCTAVWIGNDNYDKMVVSYGGYIPAFIWQRFMKEALKDMPKVDFAKPVIGKKAVIVCKETGQRATSFCPHSMKKYLSHDEAIKLPFCKKHAPKVKKVEPKKTKTPEPAKTKEESLEDLPFSDEIKADEKVNIPSLKPEVKETTAPAPQEPQEDLPVVRETTPTEGQTTEGP
ncbi:MAG: penicillin-binding protein 1A [Armatimonadota bacterium]